MYIFCMHICEFARIRENVHGQLASILETYNGKQKKCHSCVIKKSGYIVHIVSFTILIDVIVKM